MDLIERQPNITWYARQNVPFKAVEEFSFAEATGYDNNFGPRTIAALKRCLQPLVHPDNEPNLNKLPAFNPQTRIRVTVEILTPDMLVGQETEADIRADERIKTLNAEPKTEPKAATVQEPFVKKTGREIHAANKETIAEWVMALGGTVEEADTRATLVDKLKVLQDA